MTYVLCFTVRHRLIKPQTLLKSRAPRSGAARGPDA